MLDHFLRPTPSIYSLLASAPSLDSAMYRCVRCVFYLLVVGFQILLRQLHGMRELPLHHRPRVQLFFFHDGAGLRSKLQIAPGSCHPPARRCSLVQPAVNYLS